MEKTPDEGTLFSLSEAVGKGEPDAAARVRNRLASADDESEMRYLEGLLLVLGEPLGELEDPPDCEDDPEEYWEEY